MEKEKRNIGLKIGIGLGLGLAGLSAAVLFLRKKKGQLALKQPNGTQENSSTFPAFTNYFGKRTFLTGYPRGIRNNNPGNIVKNEEVWKGEVPEEQTTGGRFKQFFTYIHGVRALIVNLRAYYFKRRLRTIKGIISRWAPPKENHTGKYIDFVSGYMGIPQDMPLTFDKATVHKLTEAIITYENGMLYLTPGMFDKAWNKL